MTPERWKKIESLFDSAAEMPAEEREAYLETACGTDRELFDEVKKLLSSLDSAESFIEIPVWTDSDFLSTAAKKELSSSIDSHMPGMPDELIGRKIGVYRLTKQIGRGGMGAVYKAERADGEFQQTVAIKLIKRGMDSDFIVRRFRHERQILASFEHPFIARLLDGGSTPDGTPYFVMEYIEGETLFNFCDEKALDLKDRLKLFQKICAAIEYAHERQIIHRDIKPSNIVINRHGSPKLLDFGIAKILDPDLIHESLNPTGSMLRMMTPDYASPEQVRGHEITPASDIYSLGVLLYELVTGHRPYNFSGRAMHEVTRVVCEVMPPLPSRIIGRNERLMSQYRSDEERSAAARRTTTGKLSAELSKGLDNIIMKALAKEPDRRYASAKNFSQDITRYLMGTKVEAPKFDTARARSTAAGNTDRGAQRAIAVLPFKFINLGPGEETDENFLGLGLADALISRLSKTRSFLVRPTSAILSLGDSISDPISAGRDLHVDLIIDGNIKKANDRVRVTVQLLDVKENSAIWATSVDERLADVLTLEDTVANKVVETLLPQLTGSELKEFAKRGTESPQAFEEYLRGRYYFNSFTEEGLAKAFVSFHSAIAADPEYALAFCGIADYYNWLGIIGVLHPQECYLPAIEAASKAVELDPGLSEAHATLGFSLHSGRYDWAGAEKHLKKAIELNPGNAVAFVWYSIVLYTEGRFDEALELAKRGIELDPLTPFNHHNLGWGLYYARRYEQAADKYRCVIRDFPDYGLGHYGLSKILRRVGDTNAAHDETDRAKTLMDGSVFSLLSEAECFAADGDHETALAKVRQLEAIAADRYVSPYQLSLVYAYLSDVENVIGCLERAYESKEAWLNWMGVDPALDLVRDDPRFNRILEQIGYRQFFSSFALSGTNVLRTDGRDAPDQQRMYDLTTLMIEEGHMTAESKTQGVRTGGWPFAWIAAAALVLFGLGATAVYFYDQYAVGRQAVEVKPASFRDPTLLVLPFESEDPALGKIGIGLADSLTQRLGNIKSISVLSASTGRAIAERDVREISKEYGAAFVIRGTLNRNGPEARLNAELVNAMSGTSIWQVEFVSAEGDYFELQTKVAERFWQSLGIEPLPTEKRQIEKSYTQNYSAYEKYLIGRSQMSDRSSEGLRNAITSFASAIADDAQFSPAFVGLADSFSLLNLYDIEPPPDAYKKAKEYATRALAIDEELADAHASMAYIKFYHERDRAGAELEFRRAIQTNPSYAQAHHWFALALGAMNKSVDALSEIQTAERLDPTSLSIRSAAGIIYFYAGRYDEGLSECEKALAIDPSFVPAHKVKRWIYTAMGDLERARESLRLEQFHSGGSAEVPGWKIIAVQLSGSGDAELADAKKTLETAIQAEEVRNNPFAYAFEIALAYDHLGESQKALDWLEAAESAGTHSFNLLEAEPRFRHLHREPRFARLISLLKRKE